MQTQEWLEFMQALCKQVETKTLSIDASLHFGDTKTVNIANALIAQLAYEKGTVHTNPAPEGRVHPPVIDNHGTSG